MPVIDRPGPGDAARRRHRARFVDPENPVAALPVRDLPPAARDMPQTGGEIGLARAH